MEKNKIPTLICPLCRKVLEITEEENNNFPYIKLAECFSCYKKINKLRE